MVILVWPDKEHVEHLAVAHQRMGGGGLPDFHEDGLE